MTQLNKLSVDQAHALVNVVQQVHYWCKIYECNKSLCSLCRATLESVNFMGNTQKGNQNFGNTYK